ncbi:polysaccharide pyruvyl transferase family protein [Ectothiorhodospiraceae bacterium WFHF3C12]|nr:polysaccharide pyruvyl transferase family protein [Ectothiorhodospiraceae bacterium WFHF3C12]
MKEDIDFYGWYGKNNCGDESFKYAHPFFFTGCDLNYDEDRFASSHVKVMGSGNVVTEGVTERLKATDCPVFALGVGLRSPADVALLEGIDLREAVFRSRRDAQLASDKGIKAIYAPDIAFCLEPEGITSVDSSLSRSADKRKLGVILAEQARGRSSTRDSYMEYLKWGLARALDALTSNYDIVFIPFSNRAFASDVTLAQDVVRRMRYPDVEILQQVFDPLDMLRFIGNFDMIVSMKFHGLIFSTIMGIPFVNVGLTRKTQGYCLEERLERQSVDRFTFTEGRFLDAVSNAEEPGVTGKLKEIKDRNRAELVALRSRIRQEWLAER